MHNVSHFLEFATNDDLTADSNMEITDEIDEHIQLVYIIYMD